MLRRCVFILGFALPSAAFAQVPSFLSGEWLVTVKGNLVASPAYPGSDEILATPYPSMSFRRPGTPERFSAMDDPLSFALYDKVGFSAGPSFKYISARKFSDHPELRGLQNVDWTVEAGVFAQFWVNDFLRTRVDVRQGFHGHKGLVVDLAADGVYRTGPWTLSAGPRMTLASSRYMDAYFEVTQSESIINGVLPAYSPGGGLRSVGASVGATYRFSPQWATSASLRYNRLIGPAGDSPIPQTFGSLNQFTFAASVAYSFVTRLD
jgi:outer membrane protein